MKDKRKYELMKDKGLDTFADTGTDMRKYELAHLKAIQEVTKYPMELIKDVMNVSQMLVLDDLARENRISYRFPEEVQVMIPYYGKLLVHNLTQNRTGQAYYTFIPKYEFANGINRAYYKGLSPVYESAKLRMDKTMKLRIDNYILSDY